MDIETMPEWFKDAVKSNTDEFNKNNLWIVNGKLQQEIAKLREALETISRGTICIELASGTAVRSLYNDDIKVIAKQALENTVE